MPLGRLGPAAHWDAVEEEAKGPGCGHEAGDDAASRAIGTVEVVTRRGQLVLATSVHSN